MQLPNIQISFAESMGVSPSATPGLIQMLTNPVSPGQQLGMGQFTLKQNNNTYPSAYMWSQGVANPEAWVWIEDTLVSGGTSGDPARKFLVPGSGNQLVNWQIECLTSTPGTLASWLDGVLNGPDEQWGMGIDPKKRSDLYKFKGYHHTSKTKL